MSTVHYAWHLSQTRVPAAWDHARGDGAVIAIIDDAVDSAHPEFAGRIVSPRDISTGAGAARGVEWEPHGTKCAGVACAGGSRVFGVAPGALLMPVRVPSLHARLGSEEEAEAIRYAAREGADVICCAWGPSCEPPEAHPLPAHTARAIDWAADHGREGKGCVVVWAAGNAGSDTALDGYADNPRVIAVGACNDGGRRSTYSDWGDALFCVFPSSDPGDPRAVHKEIVTTTPSGSFALGETWYTDSFGMTSAACAGVAGVCALIVSANPALTGQQIREILRDSCVKITPEEAGYDERGHSPYYGYGRPDALAAVHLALEAAPRGRGPPARG